MTLFGQSDGLRGSLEEWVLKISAPSFHWSDMVESKYLVPKFNKQTSKPKQVGLNIAPT